MLSESRDRSNAILVCIATALLVVLGLTMLASTSVWIEEDTGAYLHLIKQAGFAGFGLLVAVLMALVNYRTLRKHAWRLYAFAIFLLILCYVPGIGKEVNGEQRWIRVPVINAFQPSEAAKIALMIGLAAWYGHNQAEVRKFKKGFLIPAAILGLPIGLIFFEKDMGTAAGLGAAGLAVLFIAGARLRYLISGAVIAAVGLFAMVYTNSNRWERIMAYTDLEAHKLGFGLQQWRALLAFGNGGTNGLGLGNGAEKHGYLPFAHTDFIFPMVGEELGLWFTLGTVFCFVMIAVYGIAIAARASDMFGRLLAAGLTCSIVIPAMMNIGVTTAVLPNTGLPLPFVSYGGTNLVFTLMTIGLLINIHRSSQQRRVGAEQLLKERKGSMRL